MDPPVRLEEAIPLLKQKPEAGLFFPRGGGGGRVSRRRGR